MELKDLTGYVGTIELAGRTLTLRQFGLTEIGLMQQWLAERLPDPMKEAKESLKALRPGPKPQAPAPPPGDASIEDKAKHGQAQAEYLNALRNWEKDNEDYEFLRDRIVTNALKSKDEGPTRAAAYKLGSQIPSLAYQVWLCSRHAHPELQPEDIERLLAAEPDLLKIKRAFDACMKIPEELNRPEGETFEDFTSRR